jgi:hypothetical protein
LHGAFAFAEQRLVLADGTESRYLTYTNQEAVSIGLEEFGLYYCNRLSFHEVAVLIRRTSGQSLVCEQTLWNWVKHKAAQLDAHLAKNVAAASQLPAPALAETVDIYDKAAEEVLVLTDGIGVKAQKPLRDKPGAERTGKTAKRHDTDVMLLQGQDGRFTYLCGTSDQRVSLCAVAQAHLRREWGARPSPLPVVALTDGAKTIRQDLAQLFGSCVRIILDWYHLAKRVYEHLSMCAHSRTEREGWEQTVLGFLWRGEVSEALSFLALLVVRNGKALAELVGYLHKHAEEIIDYGRRQATGKSIGSGRMEKAVDQVIGSRQKKKGMSWSKAGSQALALLKIAELNGLWQQLWNGLSMAA